jgi:hypothetical protein
LMIHSIRSFGENSEGISPFKMAVHVMRRIHERMLDSPESVDQSELFNMMLQIDS